MARLLGRGKVPSSVRERFETWEEEKRLARERAEEAERERAVRFGEGGKPGMYAAENLAHYENIFRGISDAQFQVAKLSDAGVSKSLMYLNVLRDYFEDLHRLLGDETASTTLPLTFAAMLVHGAGLIDRRVIMRFDNIDTNTLDTPVGVHGMSSTKLGGGAPMMRITEPMMSEMFPIAPVALVAMEMKAYLKRQGSMLFTVAIPRDLERESRDLLKLIALTSHFLGHAIRGGPTSRSTVLSNQWGHDTNIINDCNVHRLKFIGNVGGIDRRVLVDPRSLGDFEKNIRQEFHL